MAHARQWRRAVVMNADIVGFSAMMACDSERTIAAVVHNMRWLARAVDAFGGRVVDATGDNLMAEFADERSAVRCSLHIQRNERERNHLLPDGLRVRFRIGIDVGEVLDLEGRLYGNCVNIASRLQSASRVSSILMSLDVAEPCSQMSVVSLDGCSPLTFKNIPESVSAVELAL